MEIIKMIGIILVSFLGIAMCCMIIMVTTVNKTLSAKRGNNEKIIKGNKPDLKALIVFQPGIGSKTTKIIEQLVKGLNEGGYTVVTNYPGEHLSTDLSQYKIVMFGSPTYASQVSQVLVEYMERVKKSSLSNVIIFSTGMNEIKPELDIMKNAIKEENIYKKIKFQATEKGNKDAYKFAKQISRDIR